MRIKTLPLPSTSLAIGWVGHFVWISSLLAQVESPVQSDARPFGLEIVDTVKLAGSDAASASFQQTTLGEFQKVVSDMAPRSDLRSDFGVAIDPARLFMATEYDVRTYFVSEDARYHNTLGINTGLPGTDYSKLILPDASSRGNKLHANFPLQEGDFVDLGRLKSGTLLDFFMIADGARGGKDIWSSNPMRNRDGLQHMVAYAKPDSPFLLIGFEDLYGGGDRDFNDLVIAVDMGRKNVQALIGSPEPSTWLLLAAGTLVLWTTMRRKRHQQAGSSPNN